MSVLFSLTQSASVYAPIIGASGVPGYSTTPEESGVRCRVEPTTRQVYDSKGGVVTADAFVLMEPGVSVGVNYKVTVDGVSYIVLKCFPVRGLSNMSHYELTCRRI